MTSLLENALEDDEDDDQPIIGMNHDAMMMSSLHHPKRVDIHGPYSTKILSNVSNDFLCVMIIMQWRFFCILLLFLFLFFFLSREAQT